MVFYSSINPVLASIGPVEIRYYSLAYIIGAVFAYFMLKKLSRERKLNISKEEALDFIAYTLLSIVIFSRVFYVLFYNLPYFIGNPLEILSVWNGGLSFHGGLVGAVLSGIWFSRKKKISFWKLADIMVIPVAFCLFLGRIGNFINGELYGRITSVSWAVKFQGVEGFRHPSQLYEALKNIFMFSVLYSIRNRKLKDGVMFSLFLVMYGTLRFFIEFLREPDYQVGLFFGILSMGQLLCIAMLFVGIPLLFYFSSRKG